MSDLTDAPSLLTRAKKLALHGIVFRWPDIKAEPWILQLIEIEEGQRQMRSMQRRRHYAKLPEFKPLVDFDWSFPKRICREEVEDLMTLRFLHEKANVVLIGPNAVGKTMIAHNLAHQALLHGHTVLNVNASEMLNGLAACKCALSLDRRLRSLARPSLLIVDELGYLSYDNRYADLLFQVVNKRYQQGSIVITSNKPFTQWPDVFPSATTVGTLIDRLTHFSEIINIEGDSYRFREALERAEVRQKQRQARRKAPVTPAVHPPVA